MISGQASLDAIAEAAALPPEDRTRRLAGLTYARSTLQQRIDEDMAVRAQHPTSEEGYRDQLAATGHWERLHELGEINCPTLILHGEQDQLVSVENAQQLSRAIPHTQLTVLAYAAPPLFTDQPEQAARIVRVGSSHSRAQAMVMARDG